MSQANGPFTKPMGELNGVPLGALLNPDFVMKGQPAQTYRSNFLQQQIPQMLNTTIATTGVGLAVAIPLQQGDVISNITFVTATTAASIPTAQYAALYDSAATPNLLATTGNLTSTARAANTVYTLPLTTQITITTAGVYRVSISFTATTVPTLLGFTSFNVIDNGAIVGSPVLAQSHGSALAGVAPATIATPTTVTTVPFVILT